MSELDLSSIQTAAARANVCAQAETLQADPTFIAERDAAVQASLQKHYLQQIIKFCDETEIEATAATIVEEVLPIDNLITSSVLDEWQTALEAKGYVVTRDGYNFRIAVE